MTERRVFVVLLNISLKLVRHPCRQADVMENEALASGKCVLYPLTEGTEYWAAEKGI